MGQSALYPRRRSGNAMLASQYFSVPVSRDVQKVFVARDVGCRDGSYVVITNADQLDAMNAKALRMEIETRVRCALPSRPVCPSPSFTVGRLCPGA